MCMACGGTGCAAAGIAAGGAAAAAAGGAMWWGGGACGWCGGGAIGMCCGISGISGVMPMKLEASRAASFSRTRPTATKKEVNINKSSKISAGQYARV
jgi:hypothetical protein